MKWSYGITTIPERIKTTFPITLDSLARAGFDKPRLFVDSCDVPSLYNSFGLEVTARYPTIRTYGNWFLTLVELYFREPHADRYAIFQDDFVTYNNLRAYLDACELPEKGYWNLYTFPPTHQLPPPDKIGWYASNQRGKSAVALVFNRHGVITLLGSLHMLERPQDVTPTVVRPIFQNGKQVDTTTNPWLKGQKSVDGGVCTAFEKATGWTEYVHNPSLTQHIGQQSSMQNREYPQAPTFRGEEFDSLNFLQGVQEPCTSTATSATQSIKHLQPLELLPRE